MQKLKWYDGAGRRYNGWRIHVRSAAITNAAAKISENTFAQLAAADQWTIVSSTTDTTQYVTTWYIDDNDNLRWERKLLTGATRVSSTATAKYIVVPRLDAPALGTIKLERDNAATYTDIGTITIGQMSINVAHWYAGGSPWGVVKFGAGVSSTTGSVDFQLRVFPDDSSTTTGYGIEDTIHLTNVMGEQKFNRYDQGMVIVPAGGKVEVWGDASADSSDGWCTLDVVQLK